MLVLIGAACSGGAALAQTAASPSSADTARDSDAIVVTAQKRSQAAQDVGISLSAYSGESLARQGVISMTDIARLSPSVGTSGSFAGQNITYSIRGVAQQDFQPHSESPVAVYIDDGYVAANNAAGIGILDIERVEILKGPQGTLFGRNATGGLVNIVTRKPTKDLSAFGQITYGSYNDIRVEAGVGGPIAENVQARIAGAYQHTDGWVKNISPTGGRLGGKESVALRGHLAMQPSEAVDLLLTGYYSNVDQSWAPYFMISTRSTLENGIPNSVIVPTASGLGDPPSDIKGRTVDSNHAVSRGAYNRIYGGTFKATADLGFADFISVSDYKVVKYKALLDDDASPSDLLDTIITAKVKNYSEEARLEKKIGNLNLTGGVYYLHIDSQTVDLERLFAPLGNLQVSSPFRLLTNSYSAFVQGEVEVAPKVTLIGGFRATREKKSFTYDAFAQTLDGAPLALARSYEGKSAQWLYSWKAQAEYRPNSDILLYAGYNRGVKAGSFNAPFAGGGTPADPEVPYKPEKLDAFEIGAKTSFLNGLGTLNGSVFYYDYTDYQSFKFVNFSSVVANNAATIKGAEFDLHLRPASGFELTAGMSYIDATVKGVTVSNALGVAVLSRKPPYTSKWQGNVAANYVIPVGGGELSLNANAQYRSSFFFSLTNFDATKVKSYALVGARIGWTTPDGAWDFAILGKNLFDKRYKTVGFDLSDFGGLSQVGIGEPRWIGGSITYKLGR
ncbi:TonB-dependent receptor [Sphingobium amiense]|uniref:TonB-dependent receptor n=2 Tax=Sphingobium amiense TaxID=135719 RepID=A0A494W0S1_9SPHN|nr:TonB-dependent receptor [Sphingobium amiense]BBD96778.1 TonB-dependent receptor [Sphingobium amiense]